MSKNEGRRKDSLTSKRQIFWLIFNAEFKFTSFEANGCILKKIQKKKWRKLKE